MSDLDRRTFLKSLLGASAVVALGLPTRTPAPTPHAPLTTTPAPALATARVKCSPGIIYMDGGAVQTGDCILVEYSHGDDGIYVVKVVHNDSEVTLAHVDRGTVRELRQFPLQTPPPKRTAHYSWPSSRRRRRA